MNKKFSTKKCPKCGGIMIVQETATFDGFVKNVKCKNCGYAHEE